jgi:uncharacterized membrane protein YphA (DoxX/SURF4 family)
MSKNSMGVFLLRASLAFTFIYAGISGFIQPENWVGFFPNFIFDILSKINMTPEALLFGWGVFEILLAIWIMFGSKITFPCLISAILLFGISFTNLSQFDVVFRDVSLGIVAIALIFLEKERVSI